MPLLKLGPQAIQLLNVATYKCIITLVSNVNMLNTYVKFIRHSYTLYSSLVYYPIERSLSMIDCFSFKLNFLKIEKNLNKFHHKSNLIVYQCETANIIVAATLAPSMDKIKLLVLIYFVGMLTFLRYVWLFSK